MASLSVGDSMVYSSTDDDVNHPVLNNVIMKCDVFLSNFDKCKGFCH